MKASSDLQMKGSSGSSLANEIANSGINAIDAVENTVFVGTNKGLYRLHSETWEKLPLDTTKAIRSLSVSGNNLYVGTGFDHSQLEGPEGMKVYMEKVMSNINSDAKAWEIFHSTDLGESWTDITPTSNSHRMRTSLRTKVLSTRNAVMALGIINFHSTDGGQTWTEFGFNSDEMMLDIFPAVAVDENTIFKTGSSGLKRSTDGGESWHPFTDGIVSTNIFNLVGFKDALYTPALLTVLTNPPMVTSRGKNSP